MHVHGSTHTRDLRVPYLLSVVGKLHFDVQLTFFKIVLDDSLDIALLGIVYCLVLQVLALRTHAVSSIHTLLKLVTLPPKDVISMLAKACVVAVAQIEWIGITRLPLAIEWCRIPNDFIHELWDANGMCAWAGTTEAEEIGWTGCRVGDVRLVVGAIEVHTVPAAEVTVSWKRFLNVFLM
jgi:hypothetical protein